MLSSLPITPLMLAFVCLMSGFAGFVDAAAGGGGLISLPAYMITGIPAHSALGTNKFSNACGTTLSVLKFWKSGATDIRIALIAAAGSFLGSAMGARLSLLMSEQTIKMMMVIILPAAAAIIMFKHDLGEVDRSSQFSRPKASLLAFFIGLFIGGYDGMFGPGTGTFAIMAFSMIIKYDLKTASGNAKILNLASNYAGFVTFAIAGTVIYSIAIPAAVCNIAGNHFGAHFALTRGAKFIRPMMMFVLALLLLKVVWDLYSM